MASQAERPSFFEGQYLGAADLEAVVAYGRNTDREHALGAHAWGIAIGLELVEIPAAGGGVDLFIMPGVAWDGYGRAIVVMNPAQAPLEKFNGLPTGSQQVWLRYDEAPFHGLRAGFESCGTNEAYSRIVERFAIEVGPFAAIRERQSGVTVADEPEADARLAGRHFSDTAPLMLDGSIPYQSFPADTARWLVPLGVANWVNGAPGALQPRSPDVLKLSRTLRQMCGAVAENLFAADGVIRLRDRFLQFKAGDSADALCDARRVQPTDLLKEPDRDDSTKTTDRLINRELVWIEGNMRATGQVRLFGTRLELRDVAGAEAGGAPLYARRAVSPHNPAAGQDFQVVIGEASDGKDRFSVGPASAYGDMKERFILRTDGVLAAGLDLPDNLQTDHVLFSRGAGLNVALATNAGASSKISFQTLPALGEAAHIGYNDGAHKLQAVVGADLANAVTLTPGGNVGVRIDDPAGLNIDASDLVVQNINANVGMTLLGPVNSTGNIHFAHGKAGPAENRAGFIQYAHAVDKMNFGTANVPRVTIDAQGSVGVGTDSPSARIDIRAQGSGLALKLDAGAIRAEDGGAATRLEVQRDGGGVRFNGARAAGDRAVITGDGRLGLGTDLPQNALHVRGNLAGAAADSSSHVALIENMAGFNADVLALRVAGGAVDDSNNFITFFDSTGPLGRIERSTTTANNPASAGSFLRLISGGADFAERLPRVENAEAIGPGRIVGVKDGRVSLSTDRADSLLVTTDRAVVVGNAQPRDSDSCETVAMVGQVRLVVAGAVESGDFIVPSGRNDGEGRAVPLAALTPAFASQVVGRAWEGKAAEETGAITVAVGVQGADAMAALSAAFSAQETRLEAMQRTLDVLLACAPGGDAPS